MGLVYVIVKNISYSHVWIIIVQIETLKHDKSVNDFINFNIL